MPATYSSAGTAKLVGVARTKFYFGTTTTTADNDAFVEIGSVMDGGNVGATAQDIPVQLVGNNTTVHLKGTFDPGTQTLQLAQDLTDAGLLALEAARVDQTNDYNVRLILPNPKTTTGTGDMIPYKAKVMGINTELGGPNNPVKATVTLGLNSIRSFTSAT